MLAFAKTNDKLITSTSKPPDECSAAMLHYSRLNMLRDILWPVEGGGGGESHEYLQNTEARTRLG